MRSSVSIALPWTSWRLSPPGILRDAGVLRQVLKKSWYCAAQYPTSIPSNSPKSISIKPFSSKNGVDGWKTFIKHAVSMALTSGLEYMAVSDLSFNAKAKTWAWFLPSLLSGVSILPWNRRMRFQSVSPWRIRKIRVFKFSVFFCSPFSKPSNLHHFLLHSTHLYFRMPLMLLPVLHVSLSQFLIIDYGKILGNHFCPPEQILPFTHGNTEAKYSRTLIILFLFSFFAFPDAQFCNDL